MEQNSVSRVSLRGILRDFKTIPDDSRITVWRTVLEIPYNKKEYLHLKKAARKCSINYDLCIRNQEETKITSIVINNLFTHSPSLQLFQSFLVRFVEPFPPVLATNEVIYFETILTILVNFCQHWLDHIPRPPYSYLSMMDIILLKQEPKIYNHLATKYIRCIDYAWDWMADAFKTIVDPMEWLILWDHIVCNEPSFLCFIPLAACKLLSRSFLTLHSREEIMKSLQDPVSHGVKSLLKEAYRMYENTPDDIHPSVMLHGFSSLIPGSYPTLNPTDLISFGNTKSGLPTTQVEDLLEKVERTSIDVESVIAEGFALRRKLLQS